MKVASSLLVVACLLLVAGRQSAAQNLQDVAILNFALNLEYLEANFYSCAAYGVPLNGSRIGGGPVAVGCTGKALLSPPVQALAVEIATNEIAHVDFLRAALGTAAVAQPLINIGSAFSDAANAAFNTTLGTPFNAYGDDTLFLHAAFIFEDVGVTAYKAAAPLITNKTYLAPAAGILAVEAYHGGAIRALLYGMADTYVFPYGAQVSTITGAIAALRAAVDGVAQVNDFGVKVNGSSIIAPVDSNSIAFGRTPKQVLPIVFLGGSTKGGFFPNGLNGTFTTVANSP